MLNIDHYVNTLTDALRRTFNRRLAYVGLQGSYLRGEATQNSDIDIMVVIHNMTVSDLDVYRTVIQGLPHFDKSCGFICSTADLAAWNPMEICNLVHSTKDYYGDLRSLIPEYTMEDVRNFAKMSLNNLYHEICHRYIHAGEEKNSAYLPGSYKSVFFIIQTIYYLRTGEFVSTKKELLSKLTGQDREVLQSAVSYPENVSFRTSFEMLFYWCQNTLASL